MKLAIELFLVGVAMYVAYVFAYLPAILLTKTIQTALGGF